MNTLVFAPKVEFAAMLNSGDKAIDLIRAALCIAGEHDPQLDPEDSYRRLAKLTERARLQIPTEQSHTEQGLSDIADKLCHLLYRQVGFSGDSEDYYNPDNSYLNRVLETRRGIPISLALVYIAVAEGLGLRIEGLGFPGHFLLKLSAGEDANSIEDPDLDEETNKTNDKQAEGVIIDPFAGQVLSIDDCKDLLAVSSGNTLPFKREFLNSIGKRAILRRMLGNLKAIYMNKSDYVQALSLCDRLLLLDKDSVQDRIDRADVLEKLECYEPAAQDLEQLLTNKAMQQGAEALKRKISDLRALVQGKPH
ncbi:MAG: transglutaminase family protein [Gammaproteobacteria bacterium]|nr:transglutaminase family protein [Gammaproteobacteria bacterium]MBQ0840259.1 transglutaminase family protein [Gammaproteobacteria bacterium]